MSGGSCRDLRKYQKEGAVMDAFSKLVSGNRSGYKTVIEKKTEHPKVCNNCNLELGGTENFCSECGTKTPKRIKWEEENRTIPKEELEVMFKKNEKSEGETLTHLRDKLNVDQLEAFNIIQQWRKEIAPKMAEDNPFAQFGL